MENQGNIMSVGSTENPGEGTSLPANLAALRDNPFGTASEVSQGATSLLRSVVCGEMPLEHGVKFGSIMGRKIKAMELDLKYGPFIR